MKFTSSQMNLLLAAGLLLLGLAPLGSAQRVGGRWTLEYEWFSTQLDERFGNAVAGPGDLNFDGYADLLIGAPDPASNQGVVRAYSGANGNLLWDWTDPHLCRWGETLDGAGDLNGDGRPDVIVGVPECFKVVALLHDGTLWWTVQSGNEDLGISVAGVGDVNLDGFDDVIVGESRASPFGLQRAGSAYVYSGRDGTVLYQFNGFVADDRLGQSVGSAGDINVDGYPDLIAGAPRADPGGLQDAGAAYVYSGRNGSLLRQFLGLQPNVGLGGLCTGAGDLDGDGYDDLLIAAPGASIVNQFAGSVFAYSGQTGALLYRIDGNIAKDRLGQAIDSIEDVDLDGVRDFAAAALEDYPGGLGRVEVYSGATGFLLDVIPGSGGGFGWDMANAGDVDRDQMADLIVGASLYHPGGAAYLFSFDPFLYAGATEISASSGLPVQVRMFFPASEALQRYALLLSGAGTGPTTLGGLEVPLGAGPLLNQMLAGQAPPNVQGAYGTLSSSAQAAARIDSHPQLAILVGRTFHMATVSYDAATLQGRLSSIAWPITVIP